MRRILLVLLALGLPAGVTAQIDRQNTPYAVFQLAERHDWELLVTLDDGAEVEGEVTGLAGDQVWLDDVAVYMGEVAEVRRHTRTFGAEAEGAVVGAVLVGGAMLWYLTDFTDAEDEDVFWAVAGAGAIGAVLGALAGWWVEPTESEWVALWPASLSP